MKFNKNEGNADRFIRVVLGVIFLLWGYFVNSWFYLLAAIALFTAATGFCLMYKIFNVNTLEKKKK